MAPSRVSGISSRGEFASRVQGPFPEHQRRSDFLDFAADPRDHVREKGVS